MDCSSFQTGLHLETSDAQVNSPGSLNTRPPPSGEVFFKLFLDSGLTLGMLGIRLYFSPAMTRQQSIGRRYGNRMPESLYKSGVYRRNRKNPALLCFRFPVAEKFPFLFKWHHIVAPATPCVPSLFILMANTITIAKHCSLAYSQYIGCLVGV